MKFIPSLSFFALHAVMLVSPIDASAQTFSISHSFGASTPEPAGATYAGVMAQGRDGNLYAASSSGGATNRGAIYRLTPAGAFAVIYSFDGTHGSSPRGGLTLGADGNFYGTAYGGGTNGYGTIFRITPAGALTVLHNFVSAEGGEPYGPPVLAADGNYYGTTSYYGTFYYGSIYRITPAGVFTVLHQFGSNSGATNGGASLAGLVLAPDGNLYGTASAGGTYGDGAIFKVTTAGAYSVIYNFQSSSGDSPYSGVTVGPDHYLYGSTPYGGANSRGVAYRIGTNGSGYTVLHSFATNSADGSGSYSGLLPASDGFYYGSTAAGGSNADGTLFKVTPAAAYTTIYTFKQTDGKQPESAIFQTTDGLIYGQTFSGGAAGPGEIFRLAANAKPFVKTLLPFGQVGATVQIIGQGFVSGSTTVSFGGKLATSVTVQSPDFLTAVIPAGALSGTVVVTTGSATLNTLSAFLVTPTITSFTPTSGKAGTKIVITGTGLTQTSSVRINNLPATQVTVISDSQISAVAPANVTTGVISVTTPGGTASSVARFSVLPVLTSFSPASGPAGTKVVITGTGLTQTSSIKVNGVAATQITVASDTQVSAVVTAATTSGPVSVTTTGGVATSAGAFTVIPAVTSFSPASGPVGTKIVITGTGLAKTTSVKINGLAATQLSVTSDTQISAVVPANATTGKLSVTAAGGSATSMASFTVTK